MKKAIKRGPKRRQDPPITVSVVLSEETAAMLGHMAQCSAVSRSQILRGVIKKEFHRFHTTCNGAEAK